MLIEDYWNDKIIYYAEFFVEIDSVESKVCKLLIFPDVVNEANVAKIIKKKFDFVSHVICIDEVGDCLSLKRNERGVSERTY